MKLPDKGWYYYENPRVGRGIICVKKQEDGQNAVWEIFVKDKKIRFNEAIFTSHRSARGFAESDDTVFRPATKKEVDKFKFNYIKSLC